MIILYKVTIGSYCEDSYTKLLVCHQDDSNVINSIWDMAEMFIELDSDYGEKILSVERILPINTSSEKEYSDIVNNIINCSN
jgi:hypothetical protein